MLFLTFNFLKYPRTFPFSHRSLSVNIFIRLTLLLYIPSGIRFKENYVMWIVVFSFFLSGYAFSYPFWCVHFLGVYLNACI